VSVHLLIGDVAKLVGVTPKTIRHYERLGLLAEPERSESGYRLYTVGDLLRLHRIRRLQRLGLSLQQIESFLGEADQEQLLSHVLHTLHAEISTQIAELEARRAQIEQLLAGDTLPLLEQPEEVPPTLRLLQEQFGDSIDLDPAVWKQDQRLFAQLDAVLWAQPEYQEQQRKLVQAIAEHPEEFRQITALAARIAKLANSPEDAPEVEDLAEEMVRLKRSNVLLAKMTDTENSHRAIPDVLGEIMTGQTATDLSPAQRRLFELVVQQEDQGPSTL
jgi:DNA-binding transcriptional MerR regulator